MRLACAKAVLFLMTTSAAAQNVNTFVYGVFHSSNGEIVVVSVYRFQDSSASPITTLLYFDACPQATTNEGCQHGFGNIPNSAFQGVVYTNAGRPDTLTLSVDTSTIPGFDNHVCVSYAGYGCGIQVPTAGGVISLSWTRTNASSTTETYTNKSYVFRKLTTSDLDTSSFFSATSQGVLLGISISDGGDSQSMGTSTSSQRLKEKFAATRANNH